MKRERAGPRRGRAKLRTMVKRMLCKHRSRRIGRRGRQAGGLKALKGSYLSGAFGSIPLPLNTRAQRQV